MRMKVIVILIFLLPVSCTEDLLDRITTNNILPEVEKPAVKSFDKMQTIIIEWDKDEGADEYILYRSEVPDGSYKEIYSGTDLSYEDNVGSYEIGKFFYYKLAKKRESNEFDKSGYVCGVVAETVKDVHEDNDEESDNKCIDGVNSINANIYYYRDGHGNVLCDNDWYSVTIDQGLYISYFFNNESPGAGGMGNLVKLVSSYTPSGVKYLPDDERIDIYNNSSERKNLSFMICFDMNNVFTYTALSGMLVVSYTLIYYSTFQIPPATP